MAGRPLRESGPIPLQKESFTPTVLVGRYPIPQVFLDDLNREGVFKRTGILRRFRPDQIYIGKQPFGTVKLEEKNSRLRVDLTGYSPDAADKATFIFTNSGDIYCPLPGNPQIEEFFPHTDSTIALAYAVQKAALHSQVSRKKYGERYQQMADLLQHHINKPPQLTR